MCEIFSKFTIKTPEQRQRSVTFGKFAGWSVTLLPRHLLTLNIFQTVDFEQVNVSWGIKKRIRPDCDI